jgi:hypothetical protein
MERLTVRSKNGEGDLKTSELNDNCEYCYDAIQKLCDYEDLEAQGLLLKLHCKVGDIVYHEKPYSTLFVDIQSYQITNIMISQNKKGNWTKKYRAMLLIDGKTTDRQINFSFDDIGKTVFLTKAEAEKALAEIKN